MDSDHAILLFGLSTPDNFSSALAVGAPFITEIRLLLPCVAAYSATAKYLKL
jgi:hypothetical protein